MSIRGVRVLVAILANWMAYSPSPWTAYRALIARRLAALDKRPGMVPVGIGEMLRRSLAKLITREAGDQAKTACGNLQVCVGLEAGIEGATHAVGRRRLERTKMIRSVEEAVSVEEEERERENLVECLNNITVETEGTEEEA